MRPIRARIRLLSTTVAHQVQQSPLLCLQQALEMEPTDASNWHYVAKCLLDHSEVENAYQSGGRQTHGVPGGEQLHRSCCVLQAHPSRGSSLPSSQTSRPTTKPSPQVGAHGPGSHPSVHPSCCSPASPSSAWLLGHVKPNSTVWQSLEQPSPLTALESSHSSPNI